MKFAQPLASPGVRESCRTPLSFNRAARRRKQAAALLAASSFLAAAFVRANTEIDFASTTTAQTTVNTTSPKLSATGTYTGGAVPGASNDVTFSAGATYTGAFFNNDSARNFGTLNDLSTTAITIGSTNANTAAPITLSGGVNSVAAANGGDAADLLYVASGSNLTIGLTGAIELTLAATGNIDVAGTLVVGPTSSTVTSGSIINGTLGLTKTGAGTMIIEGTANYTGGTTITAGKLQFGNAAVAGTITGDTLNNSALVFSSTVAQTYAGNISGTGTVTKNGTGVQTISGTSNTYMGATAVNAGTLELGSFASLPTTSAITVASGSTLAIAVGGGTNPTTSANVAALPSSPNVTLSSGAFLGVDTSGGAFTVADNLTGAYGLNKLGANTLTLSGANTYTGTTLITAGTLLASGAVGALPTGSAVSIAPGGTLSIRNDATGTIAQGNNITLNASGTATINVGGVSGTTTGSTVQFGTVGIGTSATSYGGTISFTGANNYLVGINTLSLSGGNANTDNLNPTSTSVTISNVVSPTTGNTGYNTLVLGGTSTGNAITGTIPNGTDPTGVNINSTGSWALTGSNTYTRVTNINAGTLIINTLTDSGSASSLGTATAGGLVLNGGTLQYIGAGSTTNRNFSLQSSSTIDASGAGALAFTQTATAVGFNGGTAAKTLTLTGTNTDNNRINAVIGNNTGATSLSKTGVGSWALAGANTYLGATTVSAGMLTITGSINNSPTVTVTGTGVLTLSNATALSDTGALSLVSGTTFNLNAGAGTTETIGSLTLDGTVEPSGIYMASDLTALDPGITFASASGETLTVGVVPEPGTLALGLLGVGLLGLAQRRRVSTRPSGSRISRETGLIA